jgi:hypothetical protein
MEKHSTNLFLILIAGISTLLFDGCKANKDEFSGPQQGYASQNFVLVDDFKVSKDSVNFLKDTLKFVAKFNEKVSYSISITGATSGAVRHLEGLSDHVNTVWDGSAELVFFKAGEICSAKLTVLGKPGIVASRSLVIQKTYKPKGLVIANMEPASAGGSYASCGFWQAGGQIACGLTNGVPPLEGSYAMVLEGKDLNGSQYIGQAATKPIFNGQGIAINPDPTDTKSISYYTKTSNPDSLWFTIFIYGTGQKDAQLYIKFDQDDDGKGGNEPASENGFELQILDLTHYGWKAFSYNYSAINLGGNTSFGGNGDGVHRPDKIVQIEYALWSKRSNVPVSVVFDCPVFTVGKPFGQQ